MKGYFVLLTLSIFTTALSKDITKILFDKRYDTDSVQFISFNTVSGKYIIKPSIDSNAYLKITLVISNEKKLAEFNEKSKLRLDKNEGKVTFTQDMGGASGELIYELLLPKNKIHIDITTQNSEIKIEGVTGNNVTIHHKQSDISVENVNTGTYSITTQSGKVEIKNVKADIKVNTTSSDVEVTQIGGSLEVVSEKGNIHFNGQNEFEVNLITKSGDVEIYIGQNAKYNVNLVANSRIEYNLNNIQFQGSITEKTLVGLLNNGKINLKASATKGKIRIYNSRV
ncbi:MAG: DUF4097 family beta strand repeat-containing protein [Bacteroidia bacterium]|nr:DUF4097 family beta strand repeat-containing protein [Bacteroidia bacterium]